MHQNRIAVCSWSLHPESPEELVAGVRAVGLSRVQLALNRLITEPAWKTAGEILRANGITIVSGMLNTRGENYSSLETIRRTGGVVPDETWEDNWRDIQAVVEVAAGLGLSLVTFHAGYLPGDPATPAFAKLLGRLRAIADAFAGKGIGIAFETGQETAATLQVFLEALDRPNVGVNFDPANMILYGKGDPIASLKLLAPWVRQVHIKDARHTAMPGTWGSEMPAGTGDVDWPAFFACLAAVRLDVDLVIEREGGAERVKDIVQARELCERLR